MRVAITTSLEFRGALCDGSNRHLVVSSLMANPHSRYSFSRPARNNRAFSKHILSARRVWQHGRLPVYLVAVLMLSVLCPASLFGARPSTAEALYRAGKYEECLETARKEFESGVRNELWSRLLIRCLMTTGGYAEALETYEQAVKRYRNSLQVRMLGWEVYRFNDLPDKAQEEFNVIFTLLRQLRYRFSGAEDQITLGRYFYKRGEDAKQILELFYDRVQKSKPEFVDAYVASAELALDKHDYQLAADVLATAEKLAPSDPQIAYLAARAWSDSDGEKAAAALMRALELNPRHVPSLLLQADNRIDAEHFEDAEKLLQLVEQINPNLPELWAYRAVIAHLQGAYEQEQQHRERALEPWKTNPAVDHLIGKKLSQKYRFAEGSRYQRLALAMDSSHVAAKFQLAQDLLRLGEEDDGWNLADETFAADEYNIVAHNLVTLHDRLNEFRTLHREGLVVRMDARESRIYGEEVLDLLAEARETLCEKYGVELKLPVIVEIFPQQQDFAIRTFGLPGGAGFLGVCFGRVITANSPASQGGSPSNWQSVLWHEFCHVVTLEKTHNKMPRWLSEGISVYEERQRDPTWGQSMTPQYREMLLGDDFTPVDELSGAFLSPPTPMHLQFAYYESSLVVEYIVETYGLDALKELLVDLGVGMPINEALPRYVGPLEQFNSEFAEFAEGRALDLGNNADWSKDDLPEQASVQELRDWNEAHPRNYWGLRLLATALAGAREWNAARPIVERLLELYPEDTTPGNALALLARIERESDDPAAERSALERLARLDSDSLSAFTRLAELCADTRDWPATAQYARRVLAVNPLMPVGHETLARAGEQLEQYDDVAEALAALGEMEPVDPAGLHYRIAVAYDKLGQRNFARRHVLIALEEAPRYREAQQLLLRIVDEDGPTSSDATPDTDASTERTESSLP